MNNLYIDVNRGEAVISPFSNAEAALPPLTQGDTQEEFRVWFMKDWNGINYTLIPVAGVTVEMALGKKQGTAAPYYTQQFTWTPSADLTKPYHYASLPLNTDEITALLGERATAGAFLEVKKVENNIPLTVLSRRVVVHASVIKPETTVVPPGLTPLYAETANVAFVKVVHWGPFDLMNRDTGRGGRIYWGDDDTLHTDPITPEP